MTTNQRANSLVQTGLAKSGEPPIAILSRCLLFPDGSIAIQCNADGTLSLPNLSNSTITGDSSITGNLAVTGTAAITSTTSFGGKAFPATNDGAALGDATHNFSDLFLASGAVVNFNNGNLTLTHSAGLLTNSGAFTNTGAVILSSTLAVTGLTTLTGGLKGGTQALSGAGAVNVTTLTTKLTTTGSAQALTLADGADGQIKTIIHDVDGGSAVLTPTTKTGFTTITFTAVGESATLQFVTTRGWIILALNGAVAA